jgi:hypothetical protein
VNEYPLNPAIATIDRPLRIAQLPVAPNGYPIPWFVQRSPDDNGAPDFRVTDGRKMKAAVREKRCWICGTKLGKLYAFNFGPAATAARTSLEPPSHRECAEYAVLACPFLARPSRQRRDGDLPDGLEQVSGPPNSGIAVVYVTKDYAINSQGEFKVGKPHVVTCYRGGKIATRAEVDAVLKQLGLERMYSTATLDILRTGR